MERDGLIEENIRLAYWTAEKFRGCGVEHEDVVGCCMLGLVKATGAYKTEKGVSFTTFAVRVMQNEVCLELRKVRRWGRPGYMESLDAEREDGLRLAELVPDPHNDYSEVEAAMLYKAWMGKLEGQEKEVVNLIFGEGLTQAEAARRMEVSQPYASRCMKRARRKMEALCAG